MSRYGKIESGFWHSPKVKQLTERGRFLLLYLLSCPHGNAAGCFVLPDGYIASDVGWLAETVRETLSELLNKGLVQRDDATNLTRITGWWGHNAIENPNVAKHITKEILGLPNCDVRQAHIDDLLARTDLHETVIQTLSKGLGKPSRNQNITQQNITQPNKAASPAKVNAKVPDEHPDFAEWYAAYPRREARGGAERAYRTARKSTDAEVLLEGARKAAQRYAGSDPQFIPLPATWLNQKRWLDDPAKPPGKPLTRAEQLYREGIV